MSSPAPIHDVDHSSDPRFVEYYARESGSAETAARFRTLRDKVLRLWEATSGRPANALDVADIGCGAGASSSLWAELGHRFHGLDVNAKLIGIARERAAAAEIDAQFEVGTATALPWPDASMDICMLPELLEHVEDWRGVLEEAARVLRPGGVVYLSTTNVLCPIQQEFTLPGYSWYPPALKRRYVRLAKTTRPKIANFATYPAVHWFSYFGLARFLAERGLQCRDRFDMMQADALSPVARAALGLVRVLPPARLMAHVLTPYLAIFAIKQLPE